MSAAVHRLPRQTLSGQLSESLRVAVLSGAFRPGAQLSETDLAQRFGVSRGPLREAMQRLVQEGLLVSHPHRGVFVVELSEADLMDVYFVREALEGAAMRRIVAGPDRETLRDRLGDCVSRMAAAVLSQDLTAVAESDLAFHRTLVDAAESPRLSRMFETVQAETKLCLHLLMAGYRSGAALVDEHARLAHLADTAPLPDLLVELTRHFGDPLRTLRQAGGGQPTPQASKDHP